jgi:MYXO-CTERM domain-containing protein
MHPAFREPVLDAPALPGRKNMLRSSLLFTAVVASSLALAQDALAFRRHRFVHVPNRGAPSGSSHRDSVRPFAGSTDAQCGVITYCGGPVLSNVQVVPVFWTDQVSQEIQGWAQDYLATLAGSELLDMLSEYSTLGKVGDACSMIADGGVEYFGPATPFTTAQTITRGTGLAAVTITPGVATGTSIDDDNAAIGAELVAQIAAGHVPAPTYDAQGYPNTIYFVFFPPGYDISAGGQSCVDFGGYHNSATYKAPASCRGQYIPYAVIPDCQTGLASIEEVTSHELAEAVTDTDVGATTPANANYGDGAWYLGPSVPCDDPSTCPSGCGEVGDVCQDQGDSTVPGSNVLSQLIWSQAQDGCAVNNPGIGTQSAPSGPPVSTCSLLLDAGAPPDDAGAGGGSSGGGDEGGIGGGSSDATSPPAYDAGSGGSLTGSKDAGDAGSGDAAAPGPASGCGCETAGSSTSRGASALGGLLVLARLLRRRRVHCSCLRATTSSNPSNASRIAHACATGSPSVAACFCASDSALLGPLHAGGNLRTRSDAAPS